MNLTATKAFERVTTRTALAGQRPRRLTFLHVGHVIVFVAV